MTERGRSARRHDIDFIRVAVFGLLMIYHASLIFGTRSWLVHADSQSRAFDLISLASHPWRISMLFFIAGVTTAGLWQRYSTEEIRTRRARQLIPPLLIGTFVIVPPQVYLLASSDFGLDMSYFSFWGLYLSFGSISDNAGGQISLVSMQHVWFLAYLWIYTVAATLLMGRLSGVLQKLSQIVGRRLSGYGLFLWPFVYLAILRVAAYPLFGETLAFFDDWYAHVVYFSFFMLGLLTANDEGFWQQVVKRRYLAAWGAIAALGVLIGLFYLYPPSQRGMAVIVLHRVVRSGLQWFAIIAILGFCRVLITKSNPAIIYLNKAMLSYYVLHQTVLILVAYWLKQMFGLGALSFVVIILATMVICAALYELQRATALAIRCVRQRLKAETVVPIVP